MKRYIILVVAWCFALLPVACDKEDTDAIRYGFGEGGIVMTVAAPSETRAINVKALTLADCTVDIYQRTAGDASDEPSETWIRHYERGECPKTVVKLLEGDYSVSVSCGTQPSDAALDACLYKGRKEFTVTAGQTQPVAVSCEPQCAVVAVGFDESIAKKELSDVRVEVSLPTSESACKSLTFTTDDTGYFNMPESGAELEWSFHAVHPEKGAVEKTGIVKNVVNGKKYALNFRYSDDLPGYIGFDLAIDETTDDHNDMLIFSPKPVLKGEEIFKADGADFADKEMALTVETLGGATVCDVKIYRVGAAAATRSGYSTRADSDSDVLLWHWQCPAEGGEPTVTGETTVTVGTLTNTETGTSLDITLNPTFFSFPIGETKLRFEILDSKEAFAENTAVIRVNEGIQSEVGACDLWANSVTLRGVSTKGAPTFKLRLQGTDEWKTVTGVSADGNEYTATFECVWEESQNTVADVPVYRPDTRWSVFANNTYEIAAVIDGHEYRTTFRPVCDQPIPYGDMADDSLSCFTKEHGSFWDSGNLKALGIVDVMLCTQGQKGDRFYACLKAGAPINNCLSAGNLFTGEFVPDDANGTVKFGQNYNWKARPTALHVKYHAKIGIVDVAKFALTKGGTDYPLTKNEDQDISVIYIAIVDWNKRHEVTSGMNDYPKGMWSPDNLKQFKEKGYDTETGGTIIGYGSIRLSASTPGDDLVDLEIPIYYYDRTAKPSKEYKIVISSATSYYGDYMVGCSTNELWLTDFSWVY